ncbi:MAG: type II toxin-antitoxin system VapC family toxin [Burkholderiales bacterium]|nr:type II toxin-antitoxin system VapC family toxin [Burkholderiales bacterium]
MFLLDTNVISELRQGKPNQSPEVRNWAAQHRASMLYLSAITILELEKGILLLERRTPPQGAALRVWLTGVRTAFAGRILPFTEQAASMCAALHVPDPRFERDAMIAATALEHGFTVATRNTQDFVNTGVQLVNPWEK